MARSDLLVSLVKAGTVGDKRSFRTTTEAIIAEERAKHHDVLADRLTHLVQSNGAGASVSASMSVTAEQSNRGKDFIAEITPRRRLDDLILPAETDDLASARRQLWRSRYDAQRQPQRLSCSHRSLTLTVKLSTTRSYSVQRIS